MESKKVRIKRRLAKSLSIVLSIVLLMSLNTFAIQLPGSPSTWAETEVNEARANNLVIGDADGNFQNDITRELFCRLIVNMVEETIGSPVAITIANPFGDTDDPDIIKANQMGIVKGVSTTEFAPDTNITREQVAVMMMRAARKLDALTGEAYTAAVNVGGISFADEGTISSWALADIKMANSLGIMNGVGGNMIDPLGKTTVEQSILLTSRLFKDYMALTGATVVLVNQAPVAKDDPIELEINEQQSVIYEASDFADDADGDSLTVFQINGVGSSRSLSHGYMTLMSDGRISYESDDIELAETENFTVTVTDGTDTEVVRVQLNISMLASGNQAPVAKADPFEAPAFLELNNYDNINAISLADDPDGDDLEIVAVNGNTGTVATSLGTAVIQNDGTLSYTSGNVDVKSDETLDVTVSDGTDIAIVHLKLTIVPLADGIPGPVSQDIEFTVNEGVYLTVDVEEIAEDSDGDNLIITSIDGELYGVSLINNAGGTGKRLVYLSEDISLNRIETLTVTVSDGSNYVDVDIKINVMETGNAAPRKIGSGTMTFPVNEQTELQITASQIATDSDGDLLYITEIARTSRAYGTASIFPFLIYNRMDFISDDITEDKMATYTLTVSDGTDEIDVPIQIPIYKVNQAPEPLGGAVPVVYTTSGTKGATFYIHPEDIATDPDGDELSIDGIYRLDYTNTSFDIPGERLDLSPHYGYVYYDEANDWVMNTPGRDLTGYIEKFFIRVTDGTDSTDVQVFIDFE